MPSAPSSFRKDLRERVDNNSPYSRPTARGSRTKSSSSSTEASSSSIPLLSSILGLFTGSFGRKRESPADDNISVSGSEDNWGGNAPQQMVGRDMFDLASAGGRAGSDFDNRAAAWRNDKGRVTRGQQTTNTKSTWKAFGLGDKQVRPSPSLPVLRGIAEERTTKTSTLSPPVASSSALTPPPQAGLRRAASTMALERFMEEEGASLRPDDLVHMAQKLVRESAPESGDGWSAGIADTGRRDAHSTPRRQTGSVALASTPGSVFSVGTAPAPLHGSSTKGRQVHYLGPGMSPRRAGFPRSKTTMKPLFEGIDNNMADDSTGKKRKVDTGDWEENASSSSSTPGSIEAANAAAAFNSRRVVSGSSSRPSRLNQSTTAVESPNADRVQKGKRRAADIMKEVIDTSLGPREPPKPSLVISEYDQPRLPSTLASSTRLAASRSGLRKSSSGSRLSARESLGASRGAAAQLEMSRGSTRTLSVLEMVSGVNPSSDAVQQASEVIEPEDQDMDDVTPSAPQFSFKPAAPAAPVAAPKPKFAAPKVPAPEVFKPLPVPSLSQSTLGASTSKSPSKSASPIPTDSAAVNSIVAASKTSPAPKFTTRSVGLGPPPVAQAAPVVTRPAVRAPSRRDPSAIYLSAKDSALNVDKAALPFYTFTIPTQAKNQPSDAVKDAARARPIQNFNFTMRQPSLSSALLSPSATYASLPPSLPPAMSAAAPSAKAPSTKWKCDTCLIQNEDEVMKCVACEADKPGAVAKAAAPAAPFALPTPPSGGFTFGGAKSTPSGATLFGKVPAPAPPVGLPTPPAGGFTFGPAPTAPKEAKVASDGHWDCTNCKLQNGAVDTEKCKTCGHPRPGDQSAIAALPVPPAGGFSGFPFGGSAAAKTNGSSSGSKPAAAASAKWRCDTCLVPNDMTVDACVCCEAKRPGAAPVPTLPAAPPAALAFGAKPAATASAKWRCDTCLVPNDMAVDACVCCEAKRPGAAPVAATPAAMPAPPAGLFSFLKPVGAPAPPAPPAGNFSFVEKPVGAPALPAPPASSWYGGIPPPGLGGPPAGPLKFGYQPTSGGYTGAPIPPPAAGLFDGSKGFTFGSTVNKGYSGFGQATDKPKPAMLAKPTGAAGEWACTLCSCTNPPEATEKCTVCDQPK